MINERNTENLVRDDILEEKGYQNNKNIIIEENKNLRIPKLIILLKND